MASVFGPLAALIGEWTGTVGAVTVPGNSSKTCYTEIQTYTPMFPVFNDVTKDYVYALSYELRLIRQDGSPFHHETGQWWWHPADSTVVRAGVVPRGQQFMAGGYANASGAGFDFTLAATAGSSTFGVLMSPSQFGTVQTLAVKSSYHVEGDRLWYQDSTVLQTMGQTFHHDSGNCLTRAANPQAGSAPACPTSGLYCNTP